MKRVRLKVTNGAGGTIYTPGVRRDVDFVPSGCALLDCVLGGGWALGRMANVVGDRSTGKSLLEIEACANFAYKFPKGKIWYREAEAAFDPDYAAELGLPVDRVDFGEKGINTKWDTVEDIFEDLKKQLEACAKRGEPGLYIIDSLDALSTRDELVRPIDKGSYGTAKAKLMGTLFRQLGRDLKANKFLLLIISQIRDRIGVSFGEKYTRTGGHAMDFYASQILWLAHLETLKQTKGGVSRATGVSIKAKCKKNKISKPFRECVFDITFGYGVEDRTASVDWLAEIKQLYRLGLKDSSVDAYLTKASKLDGAEYQKERELVVQAVQAAWAEVEGRFAPTRKKYG